MTDYKTWFENNRPRNVIAAPHNNFITSVHYPPFDIEEMYQAFKARLADENCLTPIDQRD